MAIERTHTHSRVETAEILWAHNKEGGLGKQPTQGILRTRVREGSGPPRLCEWIAE